eukprot:542113-Alexandrium_andersonii.AAC.1
MTRWTKRWRAYGGSGTASGSCSRQTTSPRWSTCAGLLPSDWGRKLCSSRLRRTNRRPMAPSRTR